MATIVVADRTAVAPFNRLVCTGDCQCSTITPPRRTRLPLLTPTALHSWLPFPLVVQGLCSCGLDGECDRISWDNIILAHWLTCNFRRLSWKKKTTTKCEMLGERIIMERTDCSFIPKSCGMGGGKVFWYLLIVDVKTTWYRISWDIVYHHFSATITRPVTQFLSSERCVHPITMSRKCWKCSALHNSSGTRQLH